MKALLVALLLSLGVAACGSFSNSGMPAQPTSTTVPTTNVNVPGANRRSTVPASAQKSSTSSTTTTSCPNSSLDGCFGFAQMSTFLNTVTPMVGQFYKEQYPKLPQPRDVVYVANGQRASEPCGGYADDQAYEYCPANRTIYIGQDVLWTFYKQAGDAAPVMALAHEWGHHIQIMKGISSGHTAADSVRFENQADCLAGAFIQYSDKQGWLEKNDIQDIDGLLQAIGSREGRSRDHGTAQERLQSFDMGLKSGAKGCNSFFPATPVA